MLAAATTSVSVLDSLIREAPYMAALVIVVIAAFWLHDRNSKRQAEAQVRMGESIGGSIEKGFAMNADAIRGDRLRNRRSTDQKAA